MRSLLLVFVIAAVQIGRVDAEIVPTYEADAWAAAQKYDWKGCAAAFDARAPKENDAANRSLWSECLARQKRWDDAAKALQPLAERDESKERALVGLGLIELERDKIDDASPYFSRILDKNPSHAHANYGFGEVHYRRYRQGVQVSRLKAEEAFAKFVEASTPGTDDVRRDDVRRKRTILAYEKAGEEAIAAEDLVVEGSAASLADAQKSVDAAILANGDIEWAHFVQGEIFYAPAAGKEPGALFDSSDDKALAAYRKAPRVARALLRIGEIEARRGKWKEAEEAFAEAALVDKRLQAAFTWLGRIAVRKGDADKAKSYWKDAVAIDKETVWGIEAQRFILRAIGGQASGLPARAEWRGRRNGARNLPFLAGPSAAAPEKLALAMNAGSDGYHSMVSYCYHHKNPYIDVAELQKEIDRGNEPVSLAGAGSRARLLFLRNEIVSIRRAVHEARLALERLAAGKLDEAVKEIDAALPYLPGNTLLIEGIATARARQAVERFAFADWKVAGIQKFVLLADDSVKPDPALLDAARAAVAEALGHLRKSGELWTYAGLLAWIAGDGDATRKAFHAAAEIQKTSATAVNNAAVATLRWAELRPIAAPAKAKGRAKAPELPPVAKAAVAEFQRAAKLDRKFADPFFNLGRLYDALGDTKRAVASYQAFVKLWKAEDGWRSHALSVIERAKAKPGRKGGV